MKGANFNTLNNTLIKIPVLISTQQSHKLNNFLKKIIMKNIKFVLPAMVYILAIAASFTSEASKSAVVVRPEHFEASDSCPSCAIPDTPGNRYGVDYQCQTIPISNVRCTCLVGVIAKNATSTGNGGATCIPLWREQLIP